MKKTKDKNDIQSAPPNFCNNDNCIILNNNSISTPNNDNDISSIIKNEKPFYSTNIKINGDIYVFSVSKSKQFPGSISIKVDELHGISPHFYYRVLDLDELKKISSSFLFCSNVTGVLNTIKHYISNSGFGTSKKSYHSFEIHEINRSGNYEESDKKFDNEISMVKIDDGEMKMNFVILLPSLEHDSFSISLYKQFKDANEVKEYLYSIVKSHLINCFDFEKKLYEEKEENFKVKQNFSSFI